MSYEKNTWEQAQVTFTYAVGNTIYGMYENKDLISQRPFVCNPSLMPDKISLVSQLSKRMVQYLKKSRWPWRSCNGVVLACWLAVAMTFGRGWSCGQPSSNDELICNESAFCRPNSLGK